MTKSQRSRLAVLTAQATRNEAEAAEFTTLSALALKFTDASQDTDAPAAVAAAAVASPAAPVGATAPPTLKTVIAAAFNSLRSGNAVAADLATARATVTQLTTDLAAASTSVTTLTGERDTARTALATSEAQCNAFAAYFGMDAKAFAGKSGTEVAALINEKISALVLEQAASLGVSAASLPAARSADSPSGNSSKELNEQYEALLAAGKSSEAGAFFAKHCERMFSKN